MHSSVLTRSPMIAGMDEVTDMVSIDPVLSGVWMNCSLFTFLDSDTDFTLQSYIQIPVLTANYRNGIGIRIRIGIRICECNKPLQTTLVKTRLSILGTRRHIKIRERSDKLPRAPAKTSKDLPVIRWIALWTHRQVKLNGWSRVQIWVDINDVLLTVLTSDLTNIRHNFDIVLWKVNPQSCHIAVYEETLTN